MRSSLSAAVIGGAFSMTVLSAALAQASPGSASAVTDTKSQQRAVLGGTGSCYQQLDGDTTVGITSQRFEPEFSDYDDRGADDFALARSCSVKSVDVVGTYFSHTGPADSESVVLYADKAGRPGEVITRQTVVGSDTTDYGSFHMVLTRPVRLDPGTYWLSVRANMDFAVGGLWGWRTTEDLSGTGALWKNPGDGLKTGCTTYRDMRACFGDVGQGPDFMFSINRMR